MKNTLTIILLILCLKSFSQCSNIKDSFTSKETTSYIIKIGGMMNIGNNIMFVKQDDKKLIGYTWIVQGVTDYENKIEDFSLLVKFEDGEVIRFTPTKDSKISNSNGYLIYAVIADLKEDDILKFKNKNVQAVRFGIKDNQGVDINLSKKNLKEFKPAADCISN